MDVGVNGGDATGLSEGQYPYAGSNTGTVFLNINSFTKFKFNSMAYIEVSDIFS